MSKLFPITNQCTVWSDWLSGDKSKLNLWSWLLSSVSGIQNNYCAMHYISWILIHILCNPNVQKHYIYHIKIVFSISPVVVLFIHHWFDLLFRFIYYYLYFPPWIHVICVCITVFAVSIDLHVKEKDLMGQLIKHLTWKDRYLLMKGDNWTEKLCLLYFNLQTKLGLYSSRKSRKEKDLFGNSMLPKAYFFRQFVCSQSREASRLSWIVSL